MIRPTGSKLHRIWRCPASAVLPQSTDDRREELTEPARNRGQEIHRYLERVSIVGASEALASVPPDLMSICRAMDLEHMPAHLSTEVAFAYNWRTGDARELGRNLGHRDYASLPVPPGEDEIACTLDVVGSASIVVDGASVLRGFVGDYKTGRTRYPRPAEYAQTLLGALCVRSVLGVEEVTMELTIIDAETGDHFPVRDTVDAWSMGAFAEELRVVMDSLPDLEAAYASGRGLAFREGPHCDYCACYKHCDAKVALIRSIPSELVKIGVSPNFYGELDIEPDAITVRNAAMAYETCERIEEICKRVRKEVCGLAYVQPIELSDGRVIERYTHSRRVVDGAVAAVVLEQRYGREAAMKAIELKVSIDAIRKVVVDNIDDSAKPRPKIETVKGDGLLDQVLSEIDRRGGLATSSGEECKPHHPRRARKRLPAT